MAHERLIADLSSQAGPVSPLSPPGVRAARWMLLAVVAVAVGVAVRGLRRNWPMALADPMFVVTTGLLLATGLSAAVLTMALAVPGAITRWWTRWIPAALLAAWGVVLAADAWLAGASFAPGWGTSCMWKTWGLGIGPAAALVWMARGAAPLDWRWTATMASVAALAFGVLGTEMVCPLTSHAHIFSWHFLPVIGTAGSVFVVVAAVAKYR